MIHIKHFLMFDFLLQVDCCVLRKVGFEILCFEQLVLRNVLYSGCSGGLSIGSLLVGSQQVGPECSSSTASMHQPPNQDKVPCPRLESSTRDITVLSKA